MKNKKTLIKRMEEFYETACDEKRENLLAQLEKDDYIVSWRDFIQLYQDKK